jgi:peptidoglycan/LPS O-acetylase OafA/YrhL
VLLQNVAIASVWTATQTQSLIAGTTAVDPGLTTVGVLTALCFVAVAAAVLTRLNTISWRWLTALGALTFPLYLIHEYWGWWFINLMSDELPRVLVLAAATLLCIAMAWCINRFVERPFGPRLRAVVTRSVARVTDRAPSL